MNAGIFPLMDSQPGGGRRVFASNVGRSRGQVSAPVAPLGCAGQAVVLTAGVRTRVLSVNGRGAFRAAAIEQSLAPVNLRFELWVDGVLAADTGTNLVTVGNGLILLGLGASGQTPAWDWVPFDSSAELWVTTNTSGSHTFGFVYDIHQ